MQLLEGRVHATRFYFLGVITTDLVFAAAALWGYYALLQSLKIDTWLTAFGVIILIGYGVQSLIQQRKTANLSAVDDKPRPIRAFMSGAIMCAANPAILMFWIFFVQQMNQGIQSDVSLSEGLVFLLSIVLGDGLWFVVLSLIVLKTKKSIGGDFLRRIQWGTAIAMILFGIVILANLLGSEKEAIQGIGNLSRMSEGYNMTPIVYQEGIRGR